MSELSKQALGSGGNSSCVELIDSEMAGWIRLKLGGTVKGIAENSIAKKYFGSVNVDRGQVSGLQVPFLSRGDDRDPKLVM